MSKIIGNTTTTPNPRPDWNQTDETKADYIKNKPCALLLLDADINETFTITPNGSPSNDGFFYASSDEKLLGLVVGNSYKVRLKVTKDEDVIYNKEFDVEASQWATDARITIEPDDVDIDQLTISDSMVYGVENLVLNSLPIASCDIYADVEFDKIEITVIGQGKQLVVKTLPEYYIPDTIARADEIKQLITEQNGGLSFYINENGKLTLSIEEE